MASGTDFSKLVALDPDEVVTHSLVRDVKLPSGKVLALITLDNGRDHTRPNTLGPSTLVELKGVLEGLAERAARTEIAAVGITGKQFILAAGADLTKVGDIQDHDTGVLMAKLGHEALGMLGELGVPSFAFINGLAVGGGTEIALNSTYRTVDSSIAALALPEVFLGLVPGWGGAWILPNLVGIENALEVIISNPLKNNRMLKAPQVLELGIADAMFGPATFLEDSLKWADGVLTGAIKVKRKNEPGKLERAVKWDIAIGIAEKTLKSRIGTVAKAPYRALELLKAAKNTDRKTGFAAEDIA
ncbi:MAG: enoyl-CoA hydratase/isomerase family protein, partial [Pseudolysinimonas sp.]